MKLVIATPLYPPEIGGPSTYAKLLEEGLPSYGIEVELVKFGDVRHLPKLIRHIAYGYRVWKAARGADAVLALDPMSVGLPAAKAAWLRRAPFLLKVVGDYAWEQGRQRFGITQSLDEFVRSEHVPFRVWLLRAIERSIALFAKKVIVPSEYLKSVVSAWRVPAEKIAVIHNGIEVPATSAATDRPPGFFVVSAGRRVPWKGFEAIERVVAKEPSWQFALLEGLPREEALSRIKAADVFVLNSDYEGLSHVLIEAMMLGVPIVATSAGGNGELIEDGTTGLLIPPRDDRALHAALARVAEDPAAARVRAAAAKERAQTLFSKRAMLSHTADLLRSL